MHTYIQSEKHEYGGLWTVGHYDTAGRWIPESDHDSAEKAAARAAFLNGAAAPSRGELIERRTVELLDAYRELAREIDGGADLRRIRTFARECKALEENLAEAIAPRKEGRS